VDTAQRRATFCRAGFAGRGMAFESSTDDARSRTGRGAAGSSGSPTCCRTRSWATSGRWSNRPHASWSRRWSGN